MFIDAVTAARIDRAEAGLSIAIAGFARAADPGSGQVWELGGGAAVLVRPGSPINKVIGVGFTGPIDERALVEVEAAWHRHGEPVRVELASVAAVEALAQLGARGYRLIGLEHVLVRRLGAEDAHRQPSADIEVDQDAPEDAWLSTLVDGFAAPDGTGQPVDTYTREAVAAVMRDFAGAPGFDRHVARLGGAVVGAATMRVHEGVALLCGASTLPAARGRGVQAALLAARLRSATLAGCALAVATTAPGSQSQRNVMRQGFTLAYVRAILVLDVAAVERGP